jgi:nitroreductase
VLELTPDELLTTTRAVRRRLDYDRPVPRDLIRECVATALQAPSGSNKLSMQFVVVTDCDKRAAVSTRRLLGVGELRPQARSAMAACGQAVAANWQSPSDRHG